jgi:hypothetical protein
MRFEWGEKRGGNEERMGGEEGMFTYRLAYLLPHDQVVKRRNERIVRRYSCGRQAFAGREIVQTSS